MLSVHVAFRHGLCSVVLPNSISALSSGHMWGTAFFMLLSECECVRLSQSFVPISGGKSPGNELKAPMEWVSGWVSEWLLRHTSPTNGLSLALSRRRTDFSCIHCCCLSVYTFHTSPPRRGRNMCFVWKMAFLSRMEFGRNCMSFSLPSSGLSFFFPPPTHVLQGLGKSPSRSKQWKGQLIRGIEPFKPWLELGFLLTK